MSAVVSLVVGYDVFTARLGIGFVFIFLAVIVSEAWPGIAERLGLPGGGEG